MSWTFVVLALVLFLFAIYIGFLCGDVCFVCFVRGLIHHFYVISHGIFNSLYNRYSIRRCSAIPIE